MMQFKKTAVFMSFGVFIFLALAEACFAQWGEAVAFYPSGHMMGTGYMGWMMIFFWGILLVILVLVIRWIAQLPGSSAREDRIGKTPLDILKERLAKGEIDIDEFQEKKNFL